MSVMYTYTPEDDKRIDRILGEVLREYSLLGVVSFKTAIDDKTYSNLETKPGNNLSIILSLQ